MLAATLLALAAAVLHAGWNLAVRQSGDRLITLWAQFTVAGSIGLVILIAAGGMPARGYPWAALSGLIHLPYCWFLARAYGHGDFSLVYPVARGGGALLAGAGGIVLLGDHLEPLGLAGLIVVGLGLISLSRGARRAQIADALVVAVAIGAYTVTDAHGIRITDTPVYAAAGFVMIAAVLSAACLATGRLPALRASVRADWRTPLLAGLASGLTYFMVQLALERAPVGYVTALRESSVLLAAFIGHRYLSEHGAKKRIIAALIVVSGLILLVIGR